MNTNNIMSRSFWALFAAGALVAGCGDDDGMMTPMDAGSRDTGMTIDSGGTDSGPADAGTDAGPPGACDQYCDTIIANCADDNAQYDDRADCIAYCGSAGWPEGTPGEMAGNTLACRIYHAEFAASSMDPTTHCPHAGPTGADVCGSVGFRTEAPTAYTRVDRMGMPAVSTALVSSAMKNAYNDADPADDAAGTFAADLIANLTGLHAALDDDLIDAGLQPCSMTDLVGTLPECLGQNYAPGKTVASLVLPDTLLVDPSAAAGFPNGRLLTDPVIDVTLSVILLELGSGTCGAAMCGATTLVGTNPTANDVAFLATFPYLAPRHAEP
jgi:hypothetical protein